MNFLKRLFYSPLYPIDDKTDTEFNYLMDNYSFEPQIFKYSKTMSDAVAILGGKEIWVYMLLRDYSPLHYPASPRFKEWNAIAIEKCVSYSTYIRSREKFLADMTKWMIDNNPIE